MPSPNQVLTHAARAAAKQPFQPPPVAASGAREGLWLEQRGGAARALTGDARLEFLRIFLKFLRNSALENA